jgi:hypothetical protein
MGQGKKAGCAFLKVGEAMVFVAERIARKIIASQPVTRQSFA